MQSLRLILLLLVAAALSSSLYAAPPGPAGAPGTPGTTRVATVKTFSVFKQLTETKAWSDKLTAMQKDLQAEEQRRTEEMRNTMGQLDSTLPTHPNYQKLLETLDKQKADYQAWGATSKIKLERENKKMLIAIYGKIEAAATQLAQENGIDIVISDNRQDFVPERISQDELSRVLGTRPVLYASRNADITELVITRLEADYAKNPSAAPAPFQPQPAPATGNGKQ